MVMHLVLRALRAALAAALLAVLLGTPAASAQAPDVDEAVRTACDVVGTASGDLEDAIPLCPQEDPAAPPAADEEEPAAAEPSTPIESAEAVVAEAKKAVEDVAEDPAVAPDRLMGLVASVVQFVRDLIGIPLAALAATLDAGLTLQAAIVDAGAAAATAAAETRDAARAAMDMLAASVADAASSAAVAFTEAAERVRNMFSQPDGASVETAPGALRLAEASKVGLLDALPRLNAID